jgi:hypothetical protein
MKANPFFSAFDGSEALRASQAKVGPLPLQHIDSIIYSAEGIRVSPI